MALLAEEKALQVLAMALLAEEKALQVLALLPPLWLFFEETCILF